MGKNIKKNLFTPTWDISAETKMPHYVADVEVWRGEGLDVVDVDVVDGVGFPGGDVEAAPHPVHLQVTIDLDIQDGQLYMAVFFWNLVKSDLFSVR